MLRGILTIVLISAMARPVWAGDLVQGTGDEAAKTAARPMAARVRAAEVWAGAALMVGGAFVALYGFGNPSGPIDHFNPAAGTFPHRAGLGAFGIGLTAAGGVLVWHGLMRPAIEVGPHVFSVQHRITF